MRTYKTKLVVSSVATIALALLTAAALNASAQVTDQAPGDRPASSTTPAAKDVTLTGRVVDLHCYMTGKFAMADSAKCTADCIRAGVPAGLETDEGLFILGQGMQGPSKSLVPLAYQQVEVRGKLFEREGLKYVDISSVQAAHKLADENSGSNEE